MNSQSASTSTSSESGDNNLINCEIIWGKGEYELDIEGDYDEGFVCSVHRVYNDGDERPLIMTRLCKSSKKAWKELKTMLDCLAEQKKSGKPMTKEQKPVVFGGSDGRSKNSASESWKYKEKIESGSSASKK